MIPPKYKALTPGHSSQAIIAASVQFLEEIWADYRDAYTFMATCRGSEWTEHPIRNNRAKQVTAVLSTYPAERFDIYFCANAFSEPRRQGIHALPSRYAWCDIDGANPEGYTPNPNILWETSPGHHQGLWIWRKAVRPEVAAQCSKLLVYEYGGDRNGWSITKMLRVPGSLNHKPEYSRPTVALKAYDARPKRRPKFAPCAKPIQQVGAFQGLFGTVNDANATEVMARYRRQMSCFARNLMEADRVIFPDRSHAIYVVVSSLVEAQATDVEIASVLLVNPHFLQKHGANAAIAEREILSIRAKFGAR